MPIPTIARPRLRPADVDRISAIADPVLRNLEISQAYHDLSDSVALRLGPAANWCTYATWASKQAGRTIRKEDLSRALEAAFRTSAIAREAAQDLGIGSVRLCAGSRGGARVARAAEQLRPDSLGTDRLAAEPGLGIGALDPLAAVWSVIEPAAALDRASSAVARGNLRVFAEIGREFARFDAECETDAPDTESRLATFLEGLRSGEPPEGQRYLREAFSSYERARIESGPIRRAQLILFADLAIGLHEQIRLQPEIMEALDAAIVDPRDVRDRLIEALFPHSALLVRARLWVARLLGRRALLDVALDALIAEARRIVRGVITRHLMSIQLSTEVHLQLGEDFAIDFAPSLREIVLPALRELLERIGASGDRPRASGAGDWGDLDDRIRFIADMFRCYQESAFLFDPPFTREQVERLDAGQVPTGSL